jgi:hypothetical protein
VLRRVAEILFSSRPYSCTGLAWRILLSALWRVREIAKEMRNENENDEAVA